MRAYAKQKILMTCLLSVFPNFHGYDRPAGPVSRNVWQIAKYSSPGFQLSDCRSCRRRLHQNRQNKFDICSEIENAISSCHFIAVIRKKGEGLFSMWQAIWLFEDFWHVVGNRECAQIVRTQRMTKDVDILEMHHRKNDTNLTTMILRNQRFFQINWESWYW